MVPVNTQVYPLTSEEKQAFHRNADGQGQFQYYSHLLNGGGVFAPQLTQRVIEDLLNHQCFGEAQQRALQILSKELAWKNTLGAVR